MTDNSDAGGASPGGDSGEGPSISDIEQRAKAKPVVILKAKKDGLRQAEAFLKNRGWNILSTDKMKEALAFLIKNQPDFLLLAADHSSKKVRILPQVVGQAFQTTIIAFCEKSSANGLKALNGLKLEFNLFPPVSGPSIERMILKIQRDKELQPKKPRTPGTIIQEGGPAGEIGSLHLNADGSAGGGIIRIDGEGGPGGATSDALASMLSQLIPSEEEESEESAENDPSITTDGPGAGHEMSSGSGANKASEKLASEQSGPQGEGFNHFDPTSGAEGDAPSAETAAPDHSGFFYNPGDTRPGHQQPPREKGSASKPGNRGNADPAVDPNDLISATGPGRKRKSQILRKDKTENSEAADRRSVIERATQDALDQSAITIVRGGPERAKSLEILRNSSHMACITIASPRFNGYMIAAMGKNRPIDDTFLKLVQEKLFLFLRNAGEIITEEDPGFHLQVRQVEFQDWALEYAEFLAKSVIGDDEDEVSMAFFPNNETKVELEQSVSENMLQIELSELRDNVPVEFDLYIYMTENQKYIRYIPTGRILFKEQKDRLQEGGVVKMHLRKESISGVKKYRAQNFLNDKIEEFEKKSNPLVSENS